MRGIKKEPRENTREYVYRFLKENIIYLNFLPGQNISEIEISEKLKVSRTPVREAFVKLSEEGLIEVYPQKGTIISKIDLSAVEDTFYMRKLIEKDILKKALSESNEDLLKDLQKNLYHQKGNLEFGNDSSEMMDLDNQFHRLIYKSVGREKSWEMIQYFSSHANRLRVFSAKEENTKHKNFNQHEEMYEIIKNGTFDKLESIVESHLSNYLEEIKFFKENYHSYFKV